MPEFDRDMVEVHVMEAIAEATDGRGIDVLSSSAEGVVAFERMDASQAVDWDALADALRERTGLDVACIADCDWSFDDREDEKATFIAFDVPGLDDDYRQSYRNKLTQPTPSLG